MLLLIYKDTSKDIAFVFETIWIWLDILAYKNFVTEKAKAGYNLSVAE